MSYLLFILIILCCEIISFSPTNGLNTNHIKQKRQQYCNPDFLTCNVRKCMYTIITRERKVLQLIRKGKLEKAMDFGTGMAESKQWIKCQAFYDRFFTCAHEDTRIYAIYDKENQNYEEISKILNEKSISLSGKNISYYFGKEDKL